MPAPRGIPKIKVTFDIDANGILSVTAKDEATGKDQKITISASSGLSKDEIEKMVQDGTAHEADDKKRREEIETRNRADQLCYAAEKALADASLKLPADKIANIEAHVKTLREAIEKQSDTAIREGMSTLEKVLHEIASAAYANAGSGATPSEPVERPRKSDDGVVDAEYDGPPSSSN
jgi:molecular chaperone DnaK